jgi:hypothetical protein
VRLSTLYFCRIIENRPDDERSTDFFLCQEFSLRNPTTFITVVRSSSHSLSINSGIFSPRRQYSALISILMVHLYRLDRTIFRYPRPPRNPVYVSRLDPSILTFSLSLHRHPYICILFNSRFISYNKKMLLRYHKNIILGIGFRREHT